jgi:hypothetical protein
MNSSTKKNEALQARLRFVEYLLEEYGTLNRRIVAGYFSISETQVSDDMTRYIKLAPGNISYDTSKKCYVKGPQFAPLWR